MTDDRHHGPGAGTPAGGIDDSVAKGGTLQVSEERLHIGIRDIVTGRVRIGTTTEMVERTVRQDVVSTHGQVKRVPIGRMLEPGESPQAPGTEGHVTIGPVFEEVLVVETRLRLTEEIHVALSKSTDEIEIPVTLRRQMATVERLPAAPIEDSPQE